MCFLHIKHYEVFYARLKNYEDADDCDHFRLDPVFQTAVGKAAVHAWCEANNVEFVIGLGSNRVLDRQIEFAFEQAKIKYKKLGKACRIHASGDHGAKYLYEEVYCDRGNAELFIKDHKN